MFGMSNKYLCDQVHAVLIQVDIKLCTRTPWICTTKRKSLPQLQADPIKRVV